MSTSTATPTIVLIHGLFVTPLSWAHSMQPYSAEGYDVIAAGWTGMDGDLEEEVADYVLHWALNPTPGVEEL